MLPIAPVQHVLRFFIDHRPTARRENYVSAEPVNMAKPEVLKDCASIPVDESQAQLKASGK